MHFCIRRALLAASLLLVPALAFAALTPLEQLGKELFFDKIASPDNQSCAACHAPRSGWTGPIAGINLHGAVYRGAVPQRFGNRKPPSAAYATQSPLFHYDAEEGLFVGGNFWDGRATGQKLGNPAADQALGPFLNPVEQNNPSRLAVLQQVALSGYAAMWTEVWGAPLAYTTPEEIALNYDRIGLAIAAYEGSSEVNAFSSKFDYAEAGLVELTPQEQWGRELFEGKGLCSACHMAPLFTDYTFDNLGTPKNLENPFYRMDRVYLDDGMPINPQGADWVDPGLGGFLATLPEAYFADLGLVKAAAVAENLGKHKVPTLRNVDLRMGRGFPKAYMHNGAFKSLKEVVHFYNTRDVEVWPAPEVPDNVNTDELGDLGLTDAEEDALVAFMTTLSDGYVLSPGKGRASALTATAEFHVRSVANAHRLTFRLPAAGPVRVDVYDVGGRRVATPLDEWRAEGWQSFDWSPRGLASGLYFVRLEIGGTAQARKVVVRN
jgi:cytochrome c peroxidase